MVWVGLGQIARDAIALYAQGGAVYAPRRRRRCAHERAHPFGAWVGTARRARYRMAPSTSFEFGPLLAFVGFRLRTAQLVMYDDFLREAPVAGLTPGQFAIMLLVEHNPGLTQQSLSDGIHIEKSTLVVRLHRLEERGLLRRIRSDNDRRSNVLEVTPEGKKCLRTMLSFVRQHEERVLSELTSSERQALLKLLGKVMLAGARARRAGSGKKSVAARSDSGSRSSSKSGSKSRSRAGSSSAAGAVSRSNARKAGGGNSKRTQAAKRA